MTSISTPVSLNSKFLLLKQNSTHVRRMGTAVLHGENRPVSLHMFTDLSTQKVTYVAKIVFMHSDFIPYTGAYEITKTTMPLATELFIETTIDGYHILIIQHPNDKIRRDSPTVRDAKNSPIPCLCFDEYIANFDTTISEAFGT